MKQSVSILVLLEDIVNIFMKQSYQNRESMPDMLVSLVRALLHA